MSPSRARFPEIADGAKLPDGVLDGEVLAWKNGRAMPFAALQRRMGRKNPGKKVMARIAGDPVASTCWSRGEDWREQPLAERRAKLSD